MSRGATVRTSLRDADTAAGRVMRTPPLEWDFREHRKRVESCHGKGDLTMPNAPYRIYAGRYAHRARNTSEAFYGDYHQAPMTMDYFVWALTNGTETVVVDLGFTEDGGTRRGRQFLRCPGKGLAEIGVDAASVQHVVLSHFHYDHVGNYALFPNATFYVQDAEMAFYTGRHAALPSFRHSIEVDDVCALVRLNYERRLVFVDGSREIVPGIGVRKVGGHTAGIQNVTVDHGQRHAVVEP